MCILDLNYPDFDYIYSVKPTEEDYNQYLEKGGKPISFTPEELEQSHEFYDFMVHKYEKKAYRAYVQEQYNLLKSLTEAEIFNDNR